MITHRFKMKDCPDANGRTPKPGESKWEIHLPLEKEGDYLVIEFGRETYDHLGNFFIDDASDRPSHNDGSCPTLPDESP